jgi:hypothetical protein
MCKKRSRQHVGCISVDEDYLLKGSTPARIAGRLTPGRMSASLKQKKQIFKICAFHPVFKKKFRRPCVGIFEVAFFEVN